MGCHKYSPMKTQRPRCVPRDCGAKQTNTPYGAKQHPHTGVWGSALIPFVTTRTQPCKYCPLWAPLGPKADNIYMVGCGSLHFNEVFSLIVKNSSIKCTYYDCFIWFRVRATWCQDCFSTWWVGRMNLYASTR